MSCSSAPRTSRSGRATFPTSSAALAALPERTLPNDGPPPAKAWPDRNPVAAARLAAVRALLSAFAEEHVIPVENVCSPDPLRRVIWSPPGTPTEEAFSRALASLGVRPWQREIVAPMLVTAFAS